MFCPKCATQNMDGARFCRACGADISLVPQAMSGRLPEQPGAELEGGRRHRRRNRAPSMEKAVKSTFMGLGFLVATIALAFLPMGRGWWFWMFIPAFSMLGGGIAEIVRLKYERSLMPSSGTLPTAVPPVGRATELSPPRSTSELMPPPPSVTEGTTRHLGSEGPTEYLGTPRGQSKSP